MQKKIAIISYFSPIENTPRTTQLLGVIKKFLKNGNNDVTLYTTKVNKSVKKHFRYNMYKLNIIKIFEISHSRFPYSKKLFYRITKFLFSIPDVGIIFGVKLFFYLINIKYDLAYIISPPFSPAFFTVLLRKNINQIIVDSGDPYSQVSHTKYKSLKKYIEKFTLDNISELIIPVQNQENDYYITKDKIAIQKQIQFFKRKKYDLYLEKDYFHIFYSGRFYSFRDPWELFTTLDEFIESKYLIKFHYFGNVLWNSFVLDYIDRLKNKENFILHGELEREYLLDIMSKMDLLINIFNEGLNQLPSKYYEYKQINKPVLNILSKKDMKKFPHINFVENKSKAISLAIKKYMDEKNFNH